MYDGSLATGTPAMEYIFDKIIIIIPVELMLNMWYESKSCHYLTHGG